jgi:hypothetical protein
VKVLVSDPFLGVDSTSCAVRVEPGGLLASWNFEEGTGAFVRDLSGNNRHGTILGNGFAWVSGVRGNAVDFDGTASLMTTGQSFLSNRSAFTLAGWIRPSRRAVPEGIIGQHGAIEMGFESFDDAESPDREWRSDFGTVSPFHRTSWHHVASVGNGAGLIASHGWRCRSERRLADRNYGSSSDPRQCSRECVRTRREFTMARWMTMRIYDSALSPAAIAFLATPTPANASPVVDAGQDVSVDVGIPTGFRGHVADDGNPAPPGRVTVVWSQLSGPASASIFNPDRLYTLVQFPVAGDYELRLTANDGELSGVDDVHVTVGGPTDAPGAGAIVEGLHRIHPNPLREKTTIDYGVAARRRARAALDSRHRRTPVTKIADDVEARGIHHAAWDGRNEKGYQAASAIYFGSAGRGRPPLHAQDCRCAVESEAAHCARPACFH